jgi:pyruvate/2-oxoglutarate dehydrogenase complex dihydrolipoamide dehydrogenase (E3) component
VLGVVLQQTPRKLNDLVDARVGDAVVDGPVLAAVLDEAAPAQAGQVIRDLGLRFPVTVVEALDRLLPREEPFAGAELARAFDARGIAVRTGVPVVAARRAGDAIVLELDDGSLLSGDRLLVAVGRRPLTRDIGVDSVGLEPGRHIEVDDQLRVPGTHWLYAVGDVNGRSLLTHSGKYQARLAADHILGERVRARSDGAGAPRVVFTEPQIAAVGHTLASARDAGIAAEAIDLPTAGTAGASFHGRGAEGTTRFVVDKERELIVGATFVGPEVADFVHAATIAVVGRVPLRTLAHAVPPFPARSELWLKFIEAYEQRRDQHGLAGSLHAKPSGPVAVAA